MEQQEEIQGKFIVAFDTIVDGEQSATDENDLPPLYESADEAFKELFDDAHSMLSNYSDEERDEYAEDVTGEMIEQMGAILASEDVAAMRKFMDEHPQCNVNNEYIVRAEDFVQGRKIIYTGK